MPNLSQKTELLPSERAIQYAEAVVAGEIPNCKWVKLACQRFLDDLKKQKTDSFPYIFDKKKADRAVRFMEKMPHTKGIWAARQQNLLFEPWQCFIECNLFGWLNKTTGLRRFRKSYERVARKNGKSLRMSARGLYLFAADGEHGAEVYAGATSEKQAMEIYRPAWLMANKLSELRDTFGVEQTGNPKNPGTMFVMQDMSKFEVVIGKPGDGASPHGALIDEYHEHDSDALVDTMQTGMGARQQPLLSIITTAGSNLGGPCYELDKEMQRLLSGVVKDDTVFAIMYGLDEGDDWTDPKNLVKANPNYGVSIFPEFLLAQLDEAKRSATKQNAFRTKHLNEWVGAKTAWMNMAAWMKQAKTMKMDDFAKYPCRVSTDLSSRKDVTAVDVTFKVDNKFYSFKKYFVPEAALEENDKYLEFELSGSLEATEGSMTDQERVEEYLKDLGRRFHVIDFTFDEWQADYMMTRLAALKVNVIKFPFSTKNISDPMKTLEALVLDGKFFHDNNPVTNWMVANVAAKPDTRGNIYPNKDRPNDPRCKIDGAVASIMSIARWFVSEEPPKQYQSFFI